MNKLTLGLALTIALTAGAASATSYIFNNTTEHMIAFEQGSGHAATCANAKLHRPDAHRIEVASVDTYGDPVYTLCD